VLLVAAVVGVVFLLLAFRQQSRRPATGYGSFGQRKDERALVPWGGGGENVNFPGPPRDAAPVEGAVREGRHGGGEKVNFPELPIDAAPAIPRGDGSHVGEDELNQLPPADVAVPPGESADNSNLPVPAPDVATVAGIRPEVSSLYSLPEFTCLRSGETLPRARINDDFCDCADGTDEPGTAACENGVFHCRGLDLPASKVRDGVCDCCDGSDEVGFVGEARFRLPEHVQRSLGRFQAPCPSRC